MGKNIRKRFLNLFKDEDFNYVMSFGKFKLLYQILFVILGFFTTYIFANSTSSNFYGTYLFIISSISFFTFFSFAGFNQSLTQSVANGYDYFLITAMKKVFKYSLLGSLAIFLFTIYYALNIEYNLIVIICLTIGGIFFPTSASLVQYQPFLNGKGKFKQDLIYRLSNLFLTYCLIFLLVLLTKNFILHFLILNGVLTTSNFFFTKSCKKSIENKEKNLKLDYEASKYSIFLTKYGILALIYTNLNYVIIGIIYSPSKLAYYSIGIQLILYVVNFSKPLFSVLLTKYSQEDSKLSKKFIFIVIVGSLILFLLINISLPIYLQILFPTYIESVNYGKLYSLILLIVPINIVFGYYFRGKVKKKIIRNAMFIPDMLGLIILIPIMILFEIYGLILVEILRHLGRFIIYLLNIKKFEFR